MNNFQRERLDWALSLARGWHQGDHPVKEVDQILDFSVRQLAPTHQRKSYLFPDDLTDVEITIKFRYQQRDHTVTRRYTLVEKPCNDLVHYSYSHLARLGPDPNVDPSIAPLAWFLSHQILEHCDAWNHTFRLWVNETTD